MYFKILNFLKLEFSSRLIEIYFSFKGDLPRTRRKISLFLKTNNKRGTKNENDINEALDSKSKRNM